MAERAREEAAGESGWSLRVGSPLGIPVRLHFTFLLLLLWFGFLAYERGGNPFRGMLYVLLLFACVVLHELGHAAMALRFGVRTRQIVLYPIGGVASLERIPGGKAELLIALAGPAVNLAIAGVLLVTTVLLGMPALARPEAMVPGRDLLPSLLATNVMLFLFNLIPAFPMDGGRVLRATLSFFLPPQRATAIAAGVGQAIAVVFGAIGLFQNQPILVFIALFVFLGAGQEAAFERGRAAISGRTAREAMVTHFDTLAPQDTLARAADLLLATHQQDFPVLDAWGRVAGVLPRSALLEGLARLGRDAAVLEIMHREVEVVPPDASLEEILPRLGRRPGHPVLVVEDGRLQGMITFDNLVELIEISRRLQPAR